MVKSCEQPCALSRRHRRVIAHRDARSRACPVGRTSAAMQADKFAVVTGLHHTCSHARMCAREDERGNARVKVFPRDRRHAWMSPPARVCVGERAVLRPPSRSCRPAEPQVCAFAYAMTHARPDAWVGAPGPVRAQTFKTTHTHRGTGARVVACTCPRSTGRAVASLGVDAIGRTAGCGQPLTSLSGTMISGPGQ